MGRVLRQRQGDAEEAPRHAPAPARRRDRQHAHDGEDGPAHPHPRPARLPHAAAQPRLVVGGLAAALRPARDVRRQPARVAVLPRAGDPGPVAGHLRPGQRALPADGPRRRAARPARRGARPRHRARRRHRLGVALPLRPRRAAVGQRPLAGHGASGPLARGVAPGRAALLRGRARRAGDLPHPAARGRARRHAGRRALPAVLLRSRAAHHQRLHPGAQRALRLRDLRQRRRGARALRRRRGAGARRAADASTPARGRCTGPAGSPTSATTCSLRDFLRALCKRVPDPALYCTEADRLHGLPAPAARARPAGSTFAVARKPRSSSSP